MQVVELHRTSYWRHSDDIVANLQMYLKEQILHVAVMRVQSKGETSACCAVHGFHCCCYGV